MGLIDVQEIPESRSSVVAGLGYDSVERSLYVLFRKNGDAWRYEGVDRCVYDEMQSAGSMGAFFAKSVRRHHPETKLTNDEWLALLELGKKISKEEREAAYARANRKLFEALRKSPRSVGF